jgi:hypothetical protein
MTPSIVPDDAPATDLFPEFATLYDLIAREVEGLSDEQLDFRSERWAWAGWSIRQQVSHIAYAIYSWVLRRLGNTLFPDRAHGIEEVDLIMTSDFDRRLDEQRYRRLPDIMDKLGDASALIKRVLSTHNAGFLRCHTYQRDGIPDHWRLMAQAHPAGITLQEDDNLVLMTFEACLRHVYFEAITHLYNIQRLKRAQGLTAQVDLPRVGYWMVQGWDQSEA